MEGCCSDDPVSGMYGMDLCDDAYVERPDVRNGMGLGVAMANSSAAAAHGQ